jgi:catechol 2,3-dioxygenase-like lactoylglutathione lyase family enzyme
MDVLAITPVLNVADVPLSIAWFEKLGWRRCWTYNDRGMIAGGADADEAGRAGFASVGSGQVEIFLCHEGQGSRGGPTPRHATDETGGVWMTWWMPSTAAVDEAHALALQHGMTVARPPTNEPWGVREFHLVHPDGHTFRVSCGLSR